MIGIEAEVAQPAMVARFSLIAHCREQRNHGWLRYLFQGGKHD
jgi:hypothetical protein